MNNELQKTEQSAVAVPTDVSAAALELAIGAGDFSRLNSEDRLKYLAATCQSVGLNPLTKPIDIISIGGKVVLYANKGCAEQLRKLHGVSIEVIEKRQEHGVYFIRVKATDAKGRTDEATGAVALPDAASGEIRANAIMKAETKAKRRVTLSICGLGILDESELDTVKNITPKTTVETAMDTPTATDRAALLNDVPEAKPVETIDVQATPEHGQSPASEAFTEAETELPDELLEHVQNALGLLAPAALKFMRSTDCPNGPWLNADQSIQHLTEARAKRIIKQTESFKAAVEKWSAR